MPPGVGCGPFWDVLGGVELADPQSTQYEVPVVGQSASRDATGVVFLIAEMLRGCYIIHAQSLLVYEP